MTKENFVLKLVGIIIIVFTLFYYNQMMGLSAELDKANKEIEKVAVMQKDLNLQKAEADNAEDTAAAETVQESKYKDGTYEGTAQGYGGEVIVQITIERDIIVDIEVIAADNEDAAYYNMAIDILDDIMEAQIAKVDTVSGATYTSTGIINAVDDALSKAVV